MTGDPLDSGVLATGPEGRQEAGLLWAQAKAQHLLDVLVQDPFTTPPRYEKLVGDLSGCYSRRINIQNRLVYEVLPDRQVVHILRMWTHYE